MTFQIGMIASDGILLASDTLTLAKTVGMNRPAERVYREKILVPLGKGIAYCCSGDDLASTVGATMADRIDPQIPDLAPFLIRCATEVMNKPAPERASGFGGSVLLACGSPVNLWCLEFNRESKDQPRAWRLPTGFVTEGDACNYAVFYLIRFFAPCRPSLPLTQLVKVAAHTVVSAGDLNPQEVYGLEIVLCRESGFERLDRKALEELESFSLGLNAEIRDKLGLPR